MKKMRLELDDLRVDSFATGGSETKMGTVEAHMPPPSMWTCPEVGCNETWNCGGGGTNTCNYTQYDHTCQHTCAEGCHLSIGGGNEFTCDPACFSHYTNCHRCTF